MSETELKNEMQLPSIAKLHLKERPAPGWFKPKLLRQPFFLKALGLLLSYSTISGFLQYLYKTHQIIGEIKDMYSIALHLFLFIGGFALLGHLNLKRFLIIFLNIPIIQIWEYFIYNKRNDIYIFYFLIATWPVFYFVWKNPELMASFGLRKKKILSDFLISVAVGSVFATYVYFVFKSYGVSFLNIGSVNVAAHLSGMCSQDLIFMNFIFAVWNRMLSRGLSQAGGMIALAVMVLALNTPLFVFYYLAGLVSAGKFAAGLFGSVLMFTLFMGITFRYLKNTLPATFLMVAVNEMLHIAGIQ
jgi:hypothetical protein